MTIGERLKEAGVVRTMLRLSDESRLLEGEPTEVEARRRAAHDARLRPARLEAARRNPRWAEVAESALVKRGRHLVHADTDEVFRIHKGVVFAPGETTVLADMVDLSFYADRDGAIVFLEREPLTWSEVVEQKAQRERRRTEPKPPMRVKP